MAAQDQQAEPSMEEILASIRRIISEEDEAPEAGDPVLDLTETDDNAPPSSASGPEDDIVFDEIEEEPEFEADPPAAPVPAAPASGRHAAGSQQFAEGILSEPAASAAAGALAKLASQLRISDAPGQTLEGLVREMLKPMLREWLDQNLPNIVESRVEAELERIARLSR